MTEAEMAVWLVTRQEAMRDLLDHIALEYQARVPGDVLEQIEQDIEEGLV